MVPDPSARVSILDKDNKVGEFGRRPHGQSAPNHHRSQFLRSGSVRNPHGAIWDHNGNIFVVEWVERSASRSYGTRVETVVRNPAVASLTEFARPSIHGPPRCSRIHGNAGSRAAGKAGTVANVVLKKTLTELGLERDHHRVRFGRAGRLHRDQEFGGVFNRMVTLAFAIGKGDFSKFGPPGRAASRCVCGSGGGCDPAPCRIEEIFDAGPEAGVLLHRPCH